MLDVKMAENMAGRHCDICGMAGLRAPASFFPYSLHTGTITPEQSTIKSVSQAEAHIRDRFQHVHMKDNPLLTLVTSMTLEVFTLTREVLLFSP